MASKVPGIIVENNVIKLDNKYLRNFQGHEYLEKLKGYSRLLRASKNSYKTKQQDKYQKRRKIFLTHRPLTRRQERRSGEIKTAHPKSFFNCEFDDLFLKISDNDLSLDRAGQLGPPVLDYTTKLHTALERGLESATYPNAPVYKSALDLLLEQNSGAPYTIFFVSAGDTANSQRLAKNLQAILGAVKTKTKFFSKESYKQNRGLKLYHFNAH